MSETDENVQVQLDWVRCRLETLDKIEAKLKEIRELAAYALIRILSPAEAAQIQEWVDVLKNEIQALDQATSEGQSLFTSFSDTLPSDKPLQ